ncbi:MAG: hypothetical protein EAZ31_01050 [Cytophagia bacterium]|nr:MAG: hypothetical protein EAZ31_01050 [Cytophagia bacterium]TAH30305.1 MAG: hypothetical protein EAZ06_03565 [Cytophagales bacterium]
MKKIIVSFLIATFMVSTLSIGSLFAQTTKYNWKKYGVSFVIPNTHALKKNTADAFESGDSKTWIEMYPYEDANETAKGMIQKVAGNGGFAVEGEGAYKSGGYDGYWLRCNTKKHPTWKFWLIGFIDPVSATNFYTIIWWKKDDKAAYKIAYDMSYSFRQIKK